MDVLEKMVEEQTKFKKFSLTFDEEYGWCGLVIFKDGYSTNCQSVSPLGVFNYILKQSENRRAE